MGSFTLFRFKTIIAKQLNKKPFVLFFHYCCLRPGSLHTNSIITVVLIELHMTTSLWIYGNTYHTKYYYGTVIIIIIKGYSLRRACLQPAPNTQNSKSRPPTTNARRKLEI